MNMPIVNLVSFAFIDPSIFAATMTLKYGKHFADNDRPANLAAFPFEHCRHILLRGPAEPSPENWDADVDQVDYPLLGGWPSARKIIDDVGAKIVEHLGAQNLQIGKAYLESLRPGGHVGWQVDDSAYGKAHARFRLLVTACAGGCLFSGGDSLAPGVGNLTFINHRSIHSAINLGPVPQISLVVDARRPILQ